MLSGTNGGLAGKKRLDSKGGGLYQRIEGRYHVKGKKDVDVTICRVIYQRRVPPIEPQSF